MIDLREIKLDLSIQLYIVFYTLERFSLKISNLFYSISEIIETSFIKFSRIPTTFLNCKYSNLLNDVSGDKLGYKYIIKLIGLINLSLMK